MAPPKLFVCAGKELFESFFPPAHQKRLSRLFDWQRDAARTLTPTLREKLLAAQALVTTWDSPSFSEDLLQISPQLRIISHCGGEVKSRFSRPLFDRLTITAAPEPMPRATAALGAAFLLYCARNLDFYRSELRKPSNKIYQALHLHGGTDSLIGRDVAMIGFGRIGRALGDLLRPFDIRWRVAKERPMEGATTLGATIRHAHIKDLLNGKPVLTGEGDFPLLEIRDALRKIEFDRFLSFEWEKKWHPQIPDARTALPHFVRWFREHCGHA